MTEAEIDGAECVLIVNFSLVSSSRVRVFFFNLKAALVRAASGGN